MNTLRESRLQTPISPFDLNQSQRYMAWREWKLRNYPSSLEDIVVSIADPRQLSDKEADNLIRLCRKTNMAVYTSNTVGDPDKEIPKSLGSQLGLICLDRNWLADKEGVTSLTVRDDGEHSHYIPYTNRPINWHTDGYYNSRVYQINSLLLHCVDRAASGGENELMDHEIAYLMMRDENPDFITAFMAPDAMTIPPRIDEHGIARPEETGPVFSINPATGDLHMRYTARTRSIEWKDNVVTREAAAYLSELFENSPYVFRGRLEPGMGLVSNNVLHTRTGFEDDDEHHRLIYRARYFNRIVGTSLKDIEFDFA